MRISILLASAAFASAVGASPGLAQAAPQLCPEAPTLQHADVFGSVPQPGLLAGDEWGVVFDSEIPATHYPIEISRLGIQYGATSDNAVEIAQDSIRIYPAGLPDPGQPQFSFGPVSLFPGFITLYDLGLIPTAPGQTRIVTQGPFTVTVKLLQDANGMTGGAPVHDSDGCQTAKNVRFVSSGASPGWSDACALGAMGDWQLQVYYRRVNCTDGGPGASYCAGNSGGLFCAICICNNAPPLGSAGGCLNGEMRSCELMATGLASVASDTLRFEARGGTSNRFGILVSGENRLPSSGFLCPEGSGISDALLSGLRCVGGSAIRHGTRVSNAAGEFGTTTPGWGAPDGPTGGVLSFSGFVPGQIRHFQLFYRDDPSANCTTGQNTSSAVSVMFTP